MNREELFYLLPYLLSLILSLGIFTYTWQHRFVRGARVYSWFVGGQSLTILAFILELVSPSLETKLLWDKFQWLADSFLVILPFLIFSVQFSEYKLRQPRLVWGYWLGIPALFTLFLLTDGLHHLIYPNPHLGQEYPFPELRYDFTIVVYGFTLLYVYPAYFTGACLLIRRALQPFNPQRFQYWTIALGFMIPITLSILALINITIAPQRDISPYSLAIGNLVVAWGLFRYRLFDLVPIARARVLENLTDAIIVLDASNRVVDINHVALANIGKKSADVIGRSVREAFAEWPDLVERVQSLDEASLEVSAKVRGEVRTYDLSISPIRDNRNNLIGRVFVAHDITKRKMLEDRYRQLSEELEERVHERTEDLRESTERYRAVVENQTEFIVRWKANGMRTFANEAYRRYFGLTPEQVVSSSFMPLVAEEDRKAVEEKIARLLSGTVDSETEVHRVIKPDGSIGWQEWVDQAIHDETGQIVEFQSVGRDITARKLAEEALREKTEELERFFDSALDLLSIADTDGYFRRLNREWEKVLGYRLEDLEGKRFLDLVHPDDQQVTLAAMAKLDAQQEVLDFTNRYRCKDGTYRWIEWRSIPYGKLIYATAHDITERKRAEEALRESENRWRTIFNESAIGIALVDEKGRPVQSNPALQRMLGYTQDELRRMSFAEFTHPEDVDLDTILYKELLDGKRNHYQIEKRYIRKDQQVVWANLIASILRDDRVKGKFVVGMAEDITERKKIETALHESEKRYRDLVEFSPVALTVHVEGRIVYINPAGVKLWGANKPEEVLGRSPLDFVHPDYHERVTERIQKIQTMDQPQPPIEVKNTRLDGEVIYTVGTGIPITYEGKPASLSVVLDITERVRAEERLRELTRHLVAAQEEERKRIAQELHDELGQALTAISLDLGNIEKALPPKALPGIRERLIDARSLADEVDERISELALDLRPSLLDDLGLVPTLHWYLNRYSQRLGIEVAMEFKALESRLPEEVETTLYRVVQEALTNIARHAQANMVSLSLERRADAVVVSIQDDGRGFDAEEMQNSGTLPEGVGLLGIHDRVSTLGGQVEIHSRPGQGTRIDIEIPL